MLIEQLRKVVISVLERNNLSSRQIKLERTPRPELGDVGMNCTSLSKNNRLTIEELTDVLLKGIEGLKFIQKVSVIGPFINFQFNNEFLFASAIKVACKKDAREGKAEKIMVEYISPNTNKPLHLGHIRNGVLGSALANILEAVGNSVIRAILVNDKGVHICKSMLAYQKWGDNKTPESSKRKGDHFVGDWYVEYSKAAKDDPSLETEIGEMLRKWESGEPEVLELWKKMNSWVYKGFEDTYNRFGFRFDKTYYESDLYLLGKEWVYRGLKDGIFKSTESQGVVYELGRDFGLNPDQTVKTATLIREDGTTVYLTQDIGTAVMKAGEFELDRSVYVVGSEQKHHFQVLFSILRDLKYEWANKCFHLSYGMVELPEGKMKSREGTVVDADDLLDQIGYLAKEEISKRKRPGCEISLPADKSEKIALAVIKFYLLSFDPNALIKFNPAESLSFEGNTGPYCLYAYARANNLLKKAKKLNVPIGLTYDKLGSSEERMLALSIAGLPQVIQQSARNFNPALLTAGVLEIAKNFHSYYGRQQIFCEDRDKSSQRIALVKATTESLSWGLGLLGIEVLDEM